MLKRIREEAAFLRPLGAEARLLSPRLAVSHFPVPLQAGCFPRATRQKSII
jgi:hypothetical protein